MSSGRPMFAYVLVEPNETKRKAFGEVRAAVAAGTSLPVLAGAPE